MKTRIVVAEDNEFLAQSIKEKLELFDDDLELVFCASDGKDLLAKLEGNHNVDIILMDIEMPGMDGIEATRLVSEKYPQINILMLTVFDDDSKIFNAVKAGAKGYLLKDEPPDKIYEAIKIIMEGGAPMSPVIAAKSLQLLKDPGRLDAEETNEDFSLTKREVEVLVQLSNGLDYNEISKNLFISPFTVRKHIENIYRKLQVNNKMKAVKKAIRNKII